MFIAVILLVVLVPELILQQTRTSAIGVRGKLERGMFVCRQTLLVSVNASDALLIYLPNGHMLTTMSMQQRVHLTCAEICLRIDNIRG